MLSRPYGTRQPFRYYGGQSTNSHEGPTARKDHLCEACLRTLFGTGMAGQYEKTSSSDTTKLWLVYPKESEELRTSAEEGCRWCSMIADTILQSLKLDKDFETINLAAGGTPDSEIDDAYNEDESDAESTHELADRHCVGQN